MCITSVYQSRETLESNRNGGELAVAKVNRVLTSHPISKGYIPHCVSLYFRETDTFHITRGKCEFYRDFVISVVVIVVVVVSIYSSFQLFATPNNHV